MRRDVRRRLTALGVWPALLDAADHVAWKLQLFCVALLHLLFSSDQLWLRAAPPPRDPLAAVLQVRADADASASPPAAARVTKRRRVLFVRHAESEWNVVFNRGLNARALASLLRAVAREWLLLPTGDSVLLDSPLSARGRRQAQTLRDRVEAARELPRPPPRSGDALLRYLSCARPGSVMAASNLRRAIDTARIASAARLQAPGERLHVLSCLQEVGRNADTLALSAPHAVQPLDTLARAPRAEKRHDELFDVAESHGNKAVRGSGRDRLRTFARWAFAQHQEVVVVYGHSLWFRAFCREFLPPAEHHEAKSVKLSNCGVVTFVLEEHSSGGGEAAEYNIQPETFEHLA